LSPTLHIISGEAFPDEISVFIVIFMVMRYKSIPPSPPEKGGNKKSRWWSESRSRLCRGADHLGGFQGGWGDLSGDKTYLIMSKSAGTTNICGHGEGGVAFRDEIYVFNPKISAVMLRPYMAKTGKNAVILNNEMKNAKFSSNSFSNT
jgi:hypothetical protein